MTSAKFKKGGAAQAQPSAPGAESCQLRPKPEAGATSGATSEAETQKTLLAAKGDTTTENEKHLVISMCFDC
jgi:hypothetical protein